MKPINLVNNIDPQEAEPGQYWHGKNGLWDGKRKRLTNEPGFLPSSVNIPYTPIGVIETDSHPVIFSTDNNYSAFGFFDESTDSYTPIFNDSTKSFKLNFDLSRPIKGEARRNYLDQIELAWFEIGTTDANPPRFSNTVTPGQNLNSFLLFPQAEMPKVALQVSGAGNLPMGGFFVAVRYLKKDGTQTRYGTLSTPVFATSDGFTTIPGTNTGKALQITLTNVDTTYDTLIICVVQRINGVDTPYELPEVPVASTVTFLYTGTENVSQITMDEVLVPGADYQNVQAMTQLDDTLYMADITEAEVIDWQKYANMVRLRWKSTAYSVGAHPVPDRDSGKLRGFMHQEVYAFYIVLKTRTGNSRAFIIPGPAPVSADTTTSSLGTAQGMTEPKYVLEDTVKNIDTIDQSGDFGIWLNQDEVYPDTDDFDSTSIGGANLRGQPVRHFRFPSLRFCKNNFYLANNDYGRTVMDVLGIEVFNVQIPVELQSKVIGWELYYAQRDFNNATVVGQSLLLFGSQANAYRSAPGNVRSTGGNWGSYQRSFSSGGITDPESLYPRNDSIRFLNTDLLINKPALIPTHLSIQLGLVIRWPTTTTNTFVNTANQVCFWLDYCNHVGNVDTPLSIPDSNFIRKLSEQQYIVNDEVSGHFNNTRLEGGFVAKLPTPGSGLMDSANWTWMRRDYDRGHNTPPLFEQTYLANLMVNRTNIYQSFYSQAVARTGFTFDTSQNNSNQTIYGGDTFASFNSINTYGLVNDLDVQNDTGHNGWHTGSADGIKVVRTFIAETVSNQAARYELAGNIYSGFIPRENTDGSGIGFLADFSRDVEPNQIGYDKSGNAVGTLLNGIAPANPNSIFVTQSPHKIIRSIKQLAEGKTNNWKNYNALDYFEMAKDKGRITNLQGMGDILIIHLSEGFYRTRSKETLTTDLAQITLGSGDIFAITPKETRPSKLGYAGTQHPLACYLTPVGYIFPDARTGEIFLFDGEELKNLSEGIRRFLNEYMTNSEYNPFSGNGITIGYDWKYERILVTVKNVKLIVGLNNFVPNYQPTPGFYAGLVPGVSIVYLRGRFLLYQGVNTSSYICDSLPVPSLTGGTFSLDEHSANGTLIATAAASDGLTPYTYAIIGGNPYGSVSINSSTGRLTVTNTTVFDYGLTPTLNLIVQVTDANGNTATATFVVNLNHVPSTPYIAPQSFGVNSNAANGYSIGFMGATNRDGGTPAWSIIGGNTDGIFAINASTGEITVTDNTHLATITSTTTYNLDIQVIMAGVSNHIITPIIATVVSGVPTYSGPTSLSIAQTTPNGTMVGIFTGGDGPGPYDYTLLSYNNPGAINLSLTLGDPLFGEFFVNNNSFLVVGGDNIWVIRIYNITNPSLYLDVTITIHIT